MYDKAEVYQEKVAPLVATLKKTCCRESIPMFFCAAIKEEDSEMVYQSEMVSYAVAGVATKDDRIAKIRNIIMGYDVVLHEKILEIELGPDLDFGEFQDPNELSDPNA